MFSKKLQNICNLLISESEKSDMSFKHACGIVQGGKLLSKGYNSNSRSRISKTSVPSIHSEVLAIYNHLKLNYQRLCREKYCCILRE